MAKKRVPKTRNAIALMMILTRKGGKHKDRKQDAQRNACREKVEIED